MRFFIYSYTVLSQSIQHDLFYYRFLNNSQVCTIPAHIHFFMDNKTHNQHCKSQQEEFNSYIIFLFYDCQLSQEYWQIVIRNYKLSTPCSAIARHYRNNNYFLVGLRSAFNDCRTALSLKFSLQQTVYLLNTIIFMREFYKHIII